MQSDKTEQKVWQAAYNKAYNKELKAELKRNPEDRTAAHSNADINAKDYAYSELSEYRHS